MQVFSKLGSTGYILRENKLLFTCSVRITKRDFYLQLRLFNQENPEKSKMALLLRRPEVIR